MNITSTLPQVHLLKFAMPLIVGLITTGVAAQDFPVNPSTQDPSVLVTLDTQCHFIIACSGGRHINHVVTGRFGPLLSQPGLTGANPAGYQ